MSNISGVCMWVGVCGCGCVGVGGVRQTRERCMQTEATVANLKIQKRRRKAGNDAKNETRQGMSKRSKDIDRKILVDQSLFLVCVCVRERESACVRTRAALLNGGVFEVKLLAQLRIHDLLLKLHQYLYFCTSTSSIPVKQIK